MGRSRGVPNSGDDDTNHRSKRRRVASSGDASDSLSAACGGAGEGGGKKALYHCNYCNKDISGKIRIKCSKCPDFDLCVECFSVGAEVTPHRSNHPYRVMDNLSFPLICPDWNADEEILLLEGIEMYGLGNWAEVAEHVGTKTKAQCIDHYTTAYMNSPCYPLPDMSHVNGKNRKELLAMAKVQGESKKDGHVDRSIGVKKPRYSADEGPSLTELSGYNSKRHEFDPEYDNDAEQALAEMEFKETDSETDRELKLRVLRIYLSRLDERKRRKEFILERNLLFPNPSEKDLTNEDKEVYHRYKVFMRFLSKEEHEALVRSVLEERKIRRRIQELQECRSAGCRTLAEAKIHIEQKRKKEHEVNAQKAKESGQLLSNTKVVHKTNRPMKIESDGNLDQKKGGASLDSTGRDSPKTTGHAGTKHWDDWDIVGFPGAELLSASEIFKGSVAKKEDAHVLFKVDPAKVDNVYDMVTKKLCTNEEAPTQRLTNIESLEEILAWQRKIERFQSSLIQEQMEGKVFYLLSCQRPSIAFGGHRNQMALSDLALWKSTFHQKTLVPF
uniref:Transcriptional adapter n=1 Tax=Oryza meridionalis TaxID=40149 RepID=A0A0E0D6W0_9ORYZ